MIEELQELYNSVWKHTPPQYHRGRKTSYGWWQETRELTLKEWVKIVRAIKTKLCIAVMKPIGPLSNFGINLLEMPPIPDVSPIYVGTFSRFHYKDKSSFKEAWKFLHPIVGNEENQRICKYYKLPELKSPSHYDY